MADIIVQASGELRYKELCFSCVLGRSGITANKREGDGATPVGRFPLRHGYYRADKIDKPQTGLLLKVIKPEDGWCDDPAMADHYNKYVTHPFAGSAENLWRDDNCYDIVIVLGHNDDPPEPGLGSAIFLHVAKPDGTPTEGCVAMTQQDLESLLSVIRPDDHLVVPSSGTRQ